MSIPVKCSLTKTDEEEVFQFDGGNNLDEAIALFGDAVVYNLYRQKLVIAARGVAVETYNKAIDEGLSHDDAWGKALDKVDSWKPGQSPVRKSKEEKALCAIVDLSDEEIEQLAAKQGVGVDDLITFRDTMRASTGWTPSE